jgi:endonuclease III
VLGQLPWVRANFAGCPRDLAVAGSKTMRDRVPHGGVTSPMPRESLTARRARAAAVLEGLRACYPDAKTELDFGTPFQLVIATLLSAQATDVSVNAATPGALRALPHARGDGGGHARGGGAVRPHDRPLPQQGEERRGGRAAHRRALRRRGAATVEELVTLPGVGRKTANVVVANAFGVPAIAVDTHVGRLARRLGFSKHLDPDKVEADLQKLFPSEEWVFLHHALILHGRRVCAARKPACGSCAVAELCPSRAG